MQKKPEIVITETDFDRLDQLLESLAEHNPNHEALADELERAEVVASKDIPNDIVTMNSTVQFSVAGSSETMELTLVYPKDMKDDGSTVSILAPAGSALLGLREGDSIEWAATQGKALSLRVEKVVYQPEREGEYHR